MTWNPDTLTTVTLPESKWSTICTALICISYDESTKGNHAEAAHWSEAYDALKEAMAV
jgi:hypothetical protein